jgi:hypothetical protein
MEILRSGKMLFVDVVCAARHDEDDEDIVYCDCPFFRIDDGERSCLAMKDSYEMAGMETRQEVVESCPLAKCEALVRLKE